MSRGTDLTPPMTRGECALEATMDKEAPASGECPMFARPQAEHTWLQRLVGDWTFEHQSGSTDEPAHTGTESVRSIGGLWFQTEGRGEMPGGEPAITMMTLGFDPGRGRYVGTWIGSMMTHLWIYDGEIDDTGALVLSAEGPSMKGDGTMARYQDIITFLGDDHRTLTSRVLGDDGQWQQFMVAHYHRKP
jgi:hypothetical protein